jgi:hypothetical protein
MTYVVRFLMFWYDFLIGDCWQIAAGVVVALAVSAIAIGVQPSLSEAFGPVLGLGIAAILTGSIWLGWRQRGA